MTAPRVLLATAFRWLSTSRLAVALMAAGFEVEVVCPAPHSLHRLKGLAGSRRLDSLAPLASLRAAIEASDADLILPGDDRTRQALHALHAAADPATPQGRRLRERVARSLGPPETYAWLYARPAVMVAAQEEGVLCPPTARVRGLADVEAWMAAHPGPAVLKTDGSSGGREVIVVADRAAAARAWRRLSAPPGLVRAAKRLLVDGDPWSLRARLTGERPSLSVQAFVDGRPANAAVACQDGRVLGAVYAEVVRSDGAAGPATVVRILQHPQMAAAVAAMVRRLRLTGLCGFDFMLEAATGRAYLIEINPRATPTAHLVAADGADPLTALHAALGASPPPQPRPHAPGRMVALFPQEMRRDPVSRYLKSAHHDVPPQAPELMALALAETRTLRAAVDRMARRLRPRLQ